MNKSNGVDHGLYHLVSGISRSWTLILMQELCVALIEKNDVYVTALGDKLMTIVSL